MRHIYIYTYVMDLDAFKRIPNMYIHIYTYVKTDMCSIE